MHALDQLPLEVLGYCAYPKRIRLVTIEVARGGRFALQDDARAPVSSHVAVNHGERAQ
jgi:hypothetical protein